MENCAVSCPVVTEAVQASSKEVRMKMALAAIVKYMILMMQDDSTCHEQH